MLPSGPSAKQLSVLWSPLTWLLFMAMLLTIEASWFAYVGAEGPRRTAQAWSLVSRVLMGWWVLIDRRARGVGMPFEAFVVFVWPFVLVYYLYRTRRFKGLLLALGLWLLSEMPEMVTDIGRLVGS